MTTISTLENDLLTAENDYGDGRKIKMTARLAEPLTDGFWCAWNGRAECFNGATCIAVLEDALRGLIGPERNAATMGRVYVTWAPKNRTPATWARWSKKWKQCTANGTAY